MNYTTDLACDTCSEPVDATADYYAGCDGLTYCDACTRDLEPSERYALDILDVDVATDRDDTRPPIRVKLGFHGIPIRAAGEGK